VSNCADCVVGCLVGEQFRRSRRWHCLSCLVVAGTRSVCGDVCGSVKRFVAVQARRTATQTEPLLRSPIQAQTRQVPTARTRATQSRHKLFLIYVTVTVLHASGLLLNTTKLSTACVSRIVFSVVLQVVLYWTCAKEVGGVKSFQLYVRSYRAYFY